jgi:hypothetical protein
VPVLLSDDYELPFAGLFQWEEVAKAREKRELQKKEQQEMEQKELEVRADGSTERSAESDSVQSAESDSDSTKLSVSRNQKSASNGNAVTPSSNWNWYVRWPMRRVTDHLANYLRKFPVSTAHQMIANAEKIRCWYFYPVSMVAHDFQPVVMAKVCERFASQNALLATHTLLHSKKVQAQMHMSKGVFVIPMLEEEEEGSEEDGAENTHRSENDAEDTSESVWTDSGREEQGEWTGSEQEGSHPFPVVFTDADFHELPQTRKGRI